MGKHWLVVSKAQAAVTFPRPGLSANSVYAAPWFSVVSNQDKSLSWDCKIIRRSMKSHGQNDRDIMVRFFVLEILLILLWYVSEWYDMWTRNKDKRFFDILDRVIAIVVATSIKITVCTKMTNDKFMVKDEKQEMLPTSSVTCWSLDTFNNLL